MWSPYEGEPAPSRPRGLLGERFKLSDVDRKRFCFGYAQVAIAALSFLGIGRSVDSQFPSVVAYICAYVFLIATFSTVVMGALASAELWQAMREADENEASGADPT